MAEYQGYPPLPKKRLKLPEWPDYPVNALPDLLYDVACTIFQITKAPFPMIVSSLLASLSLAAQGAYDIKPRENGGVIPVSLYILTLALSGERKSTVDKLTMRIFREENRKARETYQKELDRYRVELELWKIEKKNLSRALSQAMKTGEDVQQCRQDLDDFLSAPLIAPQRRQLLYENATDRALLEGLRGSGVSAALISDEGGSILKSNIFSNPDTLNALWDGRDYYLDRMDDNFTIENGRLTVYIQIQPALWLNSPKLADKYFRESGLGARFLISCPESMQGHRRESSYRTPQLEKSGAWQTFENLLRRLLKEGQHNLGKRKVLTIMDRTAMVNLTNNIEGELNRGQTLDTFNDVGSKIGENTLRIASLFHLCTNLEDEVPTQLTAQCIHDAHDLYAWYVNQFRGLFGEEAQETRDARKLLTWIQSKMVHPQGIRGLEISYIQQCGPNALRKNGRMNRAIAKIIEMYPHSYQIIVPPGTKPGTSGPKLFVSSIQINRYWPAFEHDIPSAE